MVHCCLFWFQNFVDVSLYVCSFYFNSVCVAEWPPFRKELLTRLTICSLCILTICIFFFPSLVLRVGFGLIAPVPGHCLLVT